MKTSIGVKATRLVRNLYLVSTPPKPPTGKSCIENCFDAATLAQKLGGKSFHYETNIIDDATQFGKQRFAEAVVLPNQKTIDFSGFRPLLDQLVAAIDLHSTGAAGPLPAAPPLITAKVV